MAINELLVKKRKKSAKIIIKVVYRKSLIAIIKMEKQIREAY